MLQKLLPVLLNKPTASYLNKKSILDGLN
jgi:hypothetical protein